MSHLSPMNWLITMSLMMLIIMLMISTATWSSTPTLPSPKYSSSSFHLPWQW